jgi:hypothetical protein
VRSRRVREGGGVNVREREGREGGRKKRLREREGEDGGVKEGGKVREGGREGLREVIRRWGTGY